MCRVIALILFFFTLVPTWAAGYTEAEEIVYDVYDTAYPGWRLRSCALLNPAPMSFSKYPVPPGFSEIPDFVRKEKANANQWADAKPVHTIPGEMLRARTVSLQGSGPVHITIQLARPSHEIAAVWFTAQTIQEVDQWLAWLKQGRVTAALVRPYQAEPCLLDGLARWGVVACQTCRVEEWLLK